MLSSCHTVIPIPPRAITQTARRFRSFPPNLISSARKPAPRFYQNKPAETFLLPSFVSTNLFLLLPAFRTSSNYNPSNLVDEVIRFASLSVNRKYYFDLALSFL